GRGLQGHGTAACAPNRQGRQPSAPKHAKPVRAIELKRGALADRGRRADRPLVSQSDKLPKKEAVMVAQLLEKLGYGIEPDQRFGGPALKRETLAVLFQGQAGDPRAPSPAYAAATLLLHLLTAVAAADGVVSEDEEEI